ncbi:alpha/beta fold hydrolase [Nocardioides sp. zg-ZUI104]|uniref:alpha/beta fold hydrolase n=1 Tax=Nocardioides faecalis TaxID=2803858 RepID=UPI001BCD6F18|nr:alpha/beta fold hydrolase [Nocardioides faecalis]MBS4751791.1 alpha/beta fold hydrolase [Nocardioides faecalis]
MTEPPNEAPSQAPDEPTGSEHRITSVSRAGLTFDVHDSGPADGEVVVLLHGFPERATCWTYVAPQLNAAGYRTLAMDQRGYSRGARPTRRRDYRTGELARDVVALIDAAVGPDGTVHLVGHDWGAIVAWSLAQHHGLRLRSLTAVSVPHPQAFVSAVKHSPQLLRSWYMGFFQLPVLPELLGAHTGRVEAMLASAGMTEGDLARYRREVVEDGALPTALNWYRALPLTDPRSARARVRVPTTMVWSDGDTAIDRWGPANSGRWVDAPFTYVELPGVTHWIPSQAPDLLASVILERVGAQ